MTPKIETLPLTKLMGMRLRMSYAHDRTGELWRAFMPRRREITRAISADLFCVQQYGGVLDMSRFDPGAEYDKWATVPVYDFGAVPAGMDTLTLAGGLYAVFRYKGDPRAYEPTFRYIFGEWLPGSIYEVDNRPHFEVMGEKYKNNDPQSEEDVWVPVRLKVKS